MKIAIVLPERLSYGGGAEAWVQRVSANLEEAGNSVTVLVPGKATRDDARSPAESDYYSRSYTLLNKLGLPGFFPPFIPYRREWDEFDLIYVTSIHPFRLFLRSRTRVILGAHDMFLSDRKVGIDSFQGFSRTLLNLSRPNVSIHTLCNPQSLRLSGTKKRVREIPNPIPREDVDPVVSSQFLVLCLGRVSKRKGGDVLMKLLGEFGTRPHLSLVVAGDVDPEFAAAIGRQTIPANVTFLGRVSEKKKYELLSRSCVLLHTSHRDSMPFVILEALSVGLPVVSSWPWTSSVYASEGITTASKDPKEMMSRIEDVYNVWAKSPADFLNRRLEVRRSALGRFSAVGILPRVRDLFTPATADL